MNTAFHKFFSLLPGGARLLLLLFALSYPLALLGQYTHQFGLYGWLAIAPAPIREGQLWRVLTYAFLANGPVDWAVSLFWLATLVGILGRNWSGFELWSYCLISTVAAGVVVAVAGPPFGVVGNGAMIFALLAAWDRLYGRERLILMGIGELSVRQAVGLVVLIEVLVLWFCLGWFVTLAMVFGGVIGWLYLFLRGKSALNRRSQQVDSERIARLEL